MLLLEKYEFKIMLTGVHEKWEDLPVYQTILYAAKTMEEVEKMTYEYAGWLLEPGVFQVRFNRFGSEQGHYVTNWEEMIR